MKVEQIMSRPALTCAVRDFANRAAQLMWDADIGCVVVLDEERIAGIITDRDLCMAAYTRGVPLQQIVVGGHRLSSRARSMVIIRLRYRNCIDRR